MPWSLSQRTVTLGTAGITSAALFLVPFGAGATTTQGQQWGRPLTATTVLDGDSLTHTFVPQGGTSPQTEPLSDPDDITLLGQDIFVGFQNGVGPQGEASSSGNLDSTVVEFTQSGQVLGQWDVAGKTDGVTADPGAQMVVATVNEDANSSLYTITPGAPRPVRHFEYGEALPHDGGTDAISVLDGQLLVSASAPGTTGAPAPQPSYPAVYVVALHRRSGIAAVNPLFYDESTATTANTGTTGKTVKLMLTDPDSNEIVPAGGPRFADEFMLTSQGDEEQIFVKDAGQPDQSLAVLTLSQSVDDTAWPDGHPGTLFSTDSTHDTVVAIRGTFPRGPVVAATPCGANSAPATCPAPPAYPANFLASLNPWTGEVSPLAVTGAPSVPQGGLLFVPNPCPGRGGSQGNGH